MDKREIRKCQVCSKENGSCFYKADALGRVIYCVCPSCAFGSNHPLAVQARVDNIQYKKGRR